MKRTISIAVMTVLVSISSTIFAFDLKDLLSGKKDSTNNIGNTIGSIVSAVTNKQITMEQLAGTWKYNSPAVTFQSDNLLKKAGGAAASKALEDKLLPIYQKSGITGMTITFGADSTFVMNVKSVKANGTITIGEDGVYVFNFKALGKVNIGKMNAYMTQTGTNEVDLTFDASKLITIVEKVAKFSNNSTLQAASKVLESYDGATLGFNIKKQ